MNAKDNNSFAEMDASLAAPAAGVRRRGLFRLLVGAVGAAIVTGITVWLLPAMGLQFTPKGLMIAAIPGAYGLVGLMECITGISYGDWARKWDSLKGWQRGVLGLFIVSVFSGLLIIAVATFLSS